jgi:hypothetical protein
MSEIRVNNITNREGSAGPSVAGIPVVDSNSHFVVPTGRTGQRYADGGENIVRDGLVLYLDAKYSYPGATGTNPDVYTWYDMSGNENNGELKNGVSYSGTDGGSLVFDGVDDYINLGKPSSLNFGTGSFSINNWFFVSTGNVIKVLCSKGTAPGSGWWMAIDNRYNSNLNALSFSVNSTSVNTSYAAITTTLSYSINVWNNISAVWDSTNKTASLYLNGSLMSTTTTQSGGSGFGGVTNTDNTNYDTIIGAYGNGTSLYFPGNIANTQIYNRALTAEEVLQNFNATRSRYGI